METKSPVEILVAALSVFEERASREEKKDAIPALRRLSRKLEIQSLELLDQRLKLTHAEATRDRETLRDLSEFGHEEIRIWAAEVLNVKRQPRTLALQNIHL